MIKEIGHFYELWSATGRNEGHDGGDDDSNGDGDKGDGGIIDMTGATGTTLPFNEWADADTGKPQAVTWKSVGDDIQDREINKYRMHVSLEHKVRGREGRDQMRRRLTPPRNSRRRPRPASS